MKRRDYELIARTLRERIPDRAGYPFFTWLVTCKALADAFAREKPGFDRDLFLTNCGVQEHER